MYPIIRRELLELLRTRKALALQFGLALTCALLVLVRWPTGEHANVNQALAVLRVVGYGLLAGVLFLTPAFPATSLVREKIKGTLPLLFNSPLRPWSIYLGKVGGVLGFAAILLAMTLPAAAACYALGGTGGSGGVAMLYVVLVVVAVQTSTLGLLVGSRAQTTDGALRAAYALVLAVTVLPLIPYALLRPYSGALPAAAGFLRCLSPIPAVMEILGQSDVGSFGMTTDGGTAWRYVILALAGSAACAAATIVRLNHRLLDRPRAAGVMTQDRSLGQRVTRRFFYLVDPQRRAGGMSLWINPVMVKEFRSRFFGRSHWTLRLVALSAVLSLAISVAATTGALGWGVEVIGGGLVLLQVALLILFAPSLAAGLVASERESGTWRLLRMTPLSSGVVLRGKLMSVAWPLLLLLCATLPGYVVLMTIKPTLIGQVERVAACLVLTAVFLVLVSASASTLFRSTAAAMTASYAAILFICAGPLLIWLGADAPFGRQTVAAALTVDPAAAALQASAMPGFAEYELLPANWWIIGVACVALLAFLWVRTWQLFRTDER